LEFSGVNSNLETCGNATLTSNLVASASVLT
jgi:hypothetical protein